MCDDGNLVNGAGWDRVEDKAHLINIEFYYLGTASSIVSVKKILKLEILTKTNNFLC